MAKVAFQDLNGKSVFITGGGSGIGAAITDGFLNQGAKVCFVQRSDATKFCNEMEEKHGSKPMFIPCDITNTPALQESILMAEKSHSPIDILINNAANDERHLTLEVTEEYWYRNQDINLKAYFFSIQAVLPAMEKVHKGNIINISSISYMMGNAGYPLYATANAGLSGMTRSLAREFGSKGIRVNAIAPGWVMTDRQLKNWATPEDMDKHLNRQCVKEFLKPEDIVGTALFLSSDTSKMITGQTIVVDGGVVTTG